MRTHAKLLQSKNVFRFQICGEVLVLASWRLSIFIKQAHVVIHKSWCTMVAWGIWVAMIGMCVFLRLAWRHFNWHLSGAGRWQHRPRVQYVMTIIHSNYLTCHSNRVKHVWARKYGWFIYLNNDAKLILFNIIMAQLSQFYRKSGTVLSMKLSCSSMIPNVKHNKTILFGNTL